MKTLSRYVIMLGIGIVVGQYSIMSLFDPEEWYKQSISLATRSFTYGCNIGSLDLTKSRCKSLGELFEQDITAKKVVK